MSLYTIREAADLIAATTPSYDAERVYQRLRTLVQSNKLQPQDNLGPKAGARLTLEAVCIARIILLVLDVGITAGGTDLFVAQIRAISARTVHGKEFSLRAAITDLQKETLDQWFLHVAFGRDREELDFSARVVVQKTLNDNAGLPYYRYWGGHAWVDPYAMPSDSQSVVEGVLLISLNSMLIPVLRHAGG